MAEDTTILEFRSVTTDEDAWFPVPITEVSFNLNVGELGLIRFQNHASRSPLPDAAMGLLELTAGEVHYRGKAWSDRLPTAASRARGSVGRFFGTYGWVKHLDIDENITLRRRHHTHQSFSEIQAECDSLAAQFGISQRVLTLRPAGVGVHDLQKAAAIRMLLGSPRLIVVDEPASCLYPDVLRVLIPQIAAARQRGAAVLWLTSDPAVWNNSDIQATFRGESTDAQVIDDSDKPMSRVEILPNISDIPTRESSVRGEHG